VVTHEIGPNRVPEITRRSYNSCMPTVDDLMRRYEDLSRRAADLRSYL